MNEKYKIAFISPLFSAGAEQKHAEVRAPSIRGQLHWWHRALGYDHATERDLYGGVAWTKGRDRTMNLSDQASRVVVRVSDVVGEKDRAPTLPHKTGGRSALRACFLPGATATVHILSRLSPLSSEETQTVSTTLRTWALLGALGYRATRGGGSFSSDALCLSSEADFISELEALPSSRKFGAALLQASYANQFEARKVVTDTMAGLSNLRDPLGYAQGRNRKTSPLRLTLKAIGDEIRICAVWDRRQEVTGNGPQDLRGLPRALGDKKLADQLNDVVDVLVG